MSAALEEDATAGPASFQANIRVEDLRWSAQDPVAITDMVLTAIAASGSAPGHNVNCDVLFADDAALRDLNSRFRDKDAPTNVLAFPSGEEPAAGQTWFLGGIALSFDRCEQESKERGISVTDHTTHLTLHGMLHLLGFDHMTEDEREEMERVEVNILAGLGIADPYEGS
ncbi:rRNA maturation RNase YbeY [Acuticoccus sp. I52.16.1]|uniref:rRNA maturation RNase YbeY n=1 Tax=Acuticoccus sp. I52.16.1 TaxID=2928472 RepID=UPI001FD0D583|nr:rRNA maturation RNase YbeY [Acuticoccus sp. I52.16.1]UOM33587.1 rRNA maturation RNase YbeY [Acuticoccus sp. I52.16.1]